MANYAISLPAEERAFLEQFTRTGAHKAREVTRARVLLASDRNLSNSAIRAALGISNKVIWRTRKRYREEGLKVALESRPRPGAPQKVTPAVEAQVTALACEEPPAGRAAWTISLLRDELAGRFGVVLGWGTVQGVLKRHQLKPWKKRCGASPSSTPPTSPA